MLKGILKSIGLTITIMSMLINVIIMAGAYMVIKDKNVADSLRMAIFGKSE